MIDLRPTCDAVATLVSAVDDDRLADPTPCSEYAVRELVEHIDQVARGADAPVSLEPGWRDGVGVRVRALGEAWRDPAAWEGTGLLDLPNATWGRIVLTEMVVHGWDLARSTGARFEPDDEPALRACLAHVVEFVPNAPVPGLWGPPADVPADAPLLDRIVAVTGRTP